MLTEQAINHPFGRLLDRVVAGTAVAPLADILEQGVDRERPDVAEAIGNGTGRQR